MKHPWRYVQFKRVFLGFLAMLSILLLVMLAASLDNVAFEPAQRFFAINETRGSFWEWTRSIGEPADLTLGEVMLVAGSLLPIFVFLLLILSPEARKRFIKIMLRVGVTAWAIYYVLTRGILPEGLFIQAQNADLENASQAVQTPPPYTPPVIPNLVLYLVSLLAMLAIVAGGFFLYRLLQPSRSPLRSLANAAHSALRDLSSGRRWDDTVITCYMRMNTAVGEHRGLFRQSAMTPAEFAHRLEASGLPSDPVRRLTRLFEKARYSQHATSEEDVNEAIACLSSILNAVGERA